MLKVTIYEDTRVVSKKFNSHSTLVPESMKCIKLDWDDGYLDMPLDSWDKLSKKKKDKILLLA